jgi:hypothetical protein
MPGFPESNAREVRPAERTGPPTQPRISRAKEVVAAAKVLVTLHKDERRLFNNQRNGGGLGPPYTQPLDSRAISAAESLVAYHHEARKSQRLSSNSRD